MHICICSDDFKFDENNLFLNGDESDDEEVNDIDNFDHVCNDNHDPRKTKHLARNLKYNEFFSDENIQEEKEDKSLPKFQKGKLEILTKIQALNEKSW